MKKRASLKTAKLRDKGCKVVARKKVTKGGKVKKVLFVINKMKPRLKVKQGG